MKDLTLAFTIIIKGAIKMNLTPDQLAEQLSEHVQHELKNLNIPAVIKHSSINQISKKRVKELNALKKYARDQFTVGLIESQIKYWSELQ